MSKSKGKASVVSGMAYHSDEDYENVLEFQDSIELVSDVDAIDLSKDNTVATALQFSHFYLSREVDPRK